MTTPARICYSGAHYHIVSRGNNKSELFVDDADRFRYLELIRDRAEYFQLKIYAYVLMSNHVHLFLETMQPNISSAMHGINWDYTSYFNKRHSRTGHLFEARFKSRLIQTDKYFLAVVRYIHLNPVKAGIVRRPEDYEWSSHRGYLHGGDACLVDPEPVLRRFGEEGGNAGQAYEEFVNQTVPAKEWRVLDRIRNGVLGELAFRKSLKR